MPNTPLSRFLAFVWRPEDIDNSVVEISHRAGAATLVDLSNLHQTDAIDWIKRSSAHSVYEHVKISPELLIHPSLSDVIAGMDATKIWVELHPWAVDGDITQYLDRTAEISTEHEVFIVLGCVNLIRRVLEDYGAIHNIALKGNEASGFVSSETILVLYSTVLEMSRKVPHPPNLFIWGGVATPEAAAAMLCTGAGGLVFESLHWLTDRVTLSDKSRQILSGLHLDHTELLGHQAGVPYRVFNKGNSQAVREAKQSIGAHCGGEDIQGRRNIAKTLVEKSSHVFETNFQPNELIPIGVEACFVRSAGERYGRETEAFIAGFVFDVHALCSQSLSIWESFLNNPKIKELGLKYPFVQGAMSWITDQPTFAAAVADAGGLPTIAFGALDRYTLQERMSELPVTLGEHPFAVNLISLPENPFRAEQFELIAETHPRFAVVAGGDLQYVLNLASSTDVSPIYIAPNLDLLRLAFERDISCVVCEGNEAGGHVGQYSLLTFAQGVLELRRIEPSLFEDRTVILAGGIFNGDSTFIAAMLGADLVQIGTSYLATEEIVETGALTKLYQRLVLESDPGSTVVSGESLGLSVRSLNTPKIEKICQIERAFLATEQDELTSRKEIEQLGAWSLFKAARGLESPNGDPIGESEGIFHGQFMSGSCAGAIHGVRNVASLHEELAQGSRYLKDLITLATHTGFSVPNATTVANRNVTQRGTRPPISKGKLAGNSDKIVITGMDMVNSLGSNCQEIWSASLAGHSGVTSVPPNRWDHSQYYDPHPLTPEKTYCNCAAFMDVEISRSDIDIPPQDFRTMTEATKLSLLLARRTLSQSGILESDVSRDRIAVIVSQNPGGVSSKGLTDMVLRDSVNEILSAVSSVVPVSQDVEEQIRAKLLKGRMVSDDTSLLGRLASAAAGFICGKYGFSGPSFSVAAACATSAVALFNAVQMINNGVIDAALIGGGEALLTGIHFLEFSALGALAGISGKDWEPHQTSRPFDMERDGMVLGEGGGMIFVEREKIALKRGAQILAYITGVGATTNHLGMVEPSRTAIERTIRDSFARIDYGPQDIGYIECHATSTQLGDLEEATGLKSFFGNGKPILVSSFKSQIGHTLGASAIISLIRAVMALNHGIIPPSINCDVPDPELCSNGSQMIVPGEPVEWNAHNGSPRRTMVNSFGFGGPSYVVHLEQSSNDLAIRMPVILESPLDDKKVELRESLSLPDGVFLYRTEFEGRPFRVGAVGKSDEDVRTRIRNLHPIDVSKVMSRRRLEDLRQQGVYLALETARTPKAAFVFPGQGSQYPRAGMALYKEIPVIRRWIERGSEAADFDLKTFLFESNVEELRRPPFLQPSMFVLEYAIAQGLMAEGVLPSALAGHSGGELAALCLAEVFSFEDGIALALERSRCLEKSAYMKFGPTTMIAVNAPFSEIERIVRQFTDVYITNKNASLQTVIGGSIQVLDELKKELNRLGHPYTALNVDHAFHLPMEEETRKAFEQFLAGIEAAAPKLPVLSNVTGKTYPNDPTEIKRLIVAQAESPVNWLQNVKSLLLDHHVRLLVEVGPGKVLGNLATYTDQRIESIPTCLRSHEVKTYRGALADLLAKGLIPGKQPLRYVPFPSTEKPLKPPILPDFPQSSSSPTQSGNEDQLGKIIRHEIDAFVLETSGRYLLNNILSAVRREYDENMTLDGLSRELHSRYPALGLGPDIETDHQAALIGSAGDEDVGTASEGSHQHDNVTEALIRIIMDSTGYERFEIEPDMDLRRDLAIRSSRLPVIILAIENHFGIKVTLEQFIHVRTIQDVSDTIIPLISAKGSAGDRLLTVDPTTSSRGNQVYSAPMTDSAIKRMIFAERPVDLNEVSPVELEPGSAVVVMNGVNGSSIGSRTKQIFREYYRATPISVEYLNNVIPEDKTSFESLQSAAGLVIILDRAMESRIADVTEILYLVTDFFLSLKAFVKSSSKRFCVLIHDSTDTSECGVLIREALTGMLASTAREFESVRFRTVEISKDTDLEKALASTIANENAPSQTMWRDARSFGIQLQEAPLDFRNQSVPAIEPGDTVVLSGGARGITSYLARSLCFFGANLVLLGTTQLNEDPELKEMAVSQDHDEENIRKFVTSKYPNMAANELQTKIARVSKSLEINQTLAELQAKGINATYIKCDVTDGNDVKRAFTSIKSKSNRIVGIVHGAGIVRDRMLGEMSQDDFSDVVKVKLLGAWNLFRAVDVDSLKFFVGLSSISVFGNPGQVNYSAGNRSMSALINRLSKQYPETLFKSLTLPPIEGTGMADNEDIRELLTMRGIEYLHAHELAELFLREICLPSPGEVVVTFGKGFTDGDSPLLPVSSSSVTDAGRQTAGIVTFRKTDFPMIEDVVHTDLRHHQLEAVCRYSKETHLWLEDHTPGESLKHPFVSGVMALETLMEASRLLYPQFKVRGARDVEFLNLLEVPPNVDRECRIVSRRVDCTNEDVICEAALETPEISPTGRITERVSMHYRAKIMLGPHLPKDLNQVEGFPLRLEEMEAINDDDPLARAWKNADPGLKGRYDGLCIPLALGSGMVHARSTCRVSEDVVGTSSASYMYSPYVLEALVQTCCRYLLTTRDASPRWPIPVKIKEVSFTRNCRAGESLRIEARITSREKDEVTWNARAVDQDSRTVMRARGMVMRMISIS